MKIFEYVEFDMQTDKPLIDQLNLKGKLGYRFICMAQKVNQAHFDFKTGQPKITITLIYEHEVTKDQYADNEADGFVYCGKCGQLKSI